MLVTVAFGMPLALAFAAWVVVLGSGPGWRHMPTKAPGVRKVQVLAPCRGCGVVRWQQAGSARMAVLLGLGCMGAQVAGLAVGGMLLALPGMGGLGWVAGRWVGTRWHGTGYGGVWRAPTPGVVIHSGAVG